MEEFANSVDQYYQALYRFGFSLAKDPDRASDLVQQTFVIWAQKGYQLKDHSKAKTWLFTTLYREHLSNARRSQRHPKMEISEVAMRTRRTVSARCICSVSWMRLFALRSLFFISNNIPTRKSPLS